MYFSKNTHILSYALMASAVIRLAIAAAFLIAFGVVQMQTVALSGRNVSIVWTSVIFHMTETVGLILLSVYLSKHYRGL